MRRHQAKLKALRKHRYRRRSSFLGMCLSFAWQKLNPLRLLLKFFANIFHSLQAIFFFHRIRPIVNRYGEKLLLKRSQLRLVDHYGIPDNGKWEREKISFIRRFLLPLPKKISLTRVSTFIDRQLERHSQQMPSLPPIASPLDYEAYCSTLLRKLGWETALTPLSGDQGVDIIATKYGVRAVFQCKWYSRPVGNKAVQEIIAGKLFQEADLAIVLSNTVFTISARQLANKTDVHLLHHSELENFTTRLTTFRMRQTINV